MINLKCWTFILMLASNAFSLPSSKPYKQKVHWAKIEISENGAMSLLERKVKLGHIDDSNSINEEFYPRDVIEHRDLGEAKILEVLAKTKQELDNYLKQKNLNLNAPAFFQKANNDEVLTLVNSGPSENRIDIVLMGDGYTHQEQDKFYLDMQRIVQDIFKEKTFKSYLPLFNVHLVFRASEESGIGKNGYPKKTAYGLYRPGDTLRAILPDNRQAARDSCAKAPDCDYPIIIANDPYYGGLGGEFAISTSSKTSGSMVLRHELGHTMGKVGEEYDGGGYFGANFADSLEDIRWEHFLSDKENLREEPSRMLHVDWPWVNLKDGPHTIIFESSKDYSVGDLQFSASGLEKSDSLFVSLDNKVQKFENPNKTDRTFIEIPYKEGFKAGYHSLTFAENDKDQNNWLSSITLMEYKKDYNFDENFYGAYPVYNKNNNVLGYRPTHNTCLMRNMSSKSFCKVCQENNWKQFFKRVKLIDSLSKDLENDQIVLKVNTLQLGQLRKDALDKGKLTVRWYKDAKEMDQFRNQIKVNGDPCKMYGSWLVLAKYDTEEINVPEQAWLKDFEATKVPKLQSCN